MEIRVIVVFIVLFKICCRKFKDKIIKSGFLNISQVTQNLLPTKDMSEMSCRINTGSAQHSLALYEEWTVYFTHSG